MTNTEKARNTKELNRINQIAQPWLPVSTERMPWTVTLRTGTEVTICCPLGAAVEIEAHGHQIIAQ